MNLWNMILLRAATAPDDGGIGAGLSLWRVFGTWLLCIGIAVALILLLRRIRTGRISGRAVTLLPRAFAASSRRIEIVETRRVNLSVDLCLFDYEGERYLLAVGPGGIEMLDRSPAPQLAGADEPAP